MVLEEQGHGGVLLKSSRCLIPPDLQSQNESPDEAQHLSSLALDIDPRFHDALSKVEPRILIPNSPYPILRIFASWPADANLERTLDCNKSRKRNRTKTQAQVDEDSVDIDPDGHPLATLHMEYFNKISLMLGKCWYMDVEEYEVVQERRVSSEVW
jgi:hypothetical protein